MSKIRKTQNNSQVVISVLGSTVGSCWDRSALTGIDCRLLLGSTVGSCWNRPSELRSARTLNLTQQTEEEEDEQ
jgi:hypothetical protein